METFLSWWSAHDDLLVRLPKAKDLMAVRSEFLKSFPDMLAPVGLLDSLKVSGAIASWWSKVQYDLKTLVSSGFEGVVESWVTTIISAVEEEGNILDLLEHQLVKRLIPEYLDEMALIEAQVLELESALGSKEPSSETEEEEEINAELLDLPDLRKRMAICKRQARAMRREFSDELRTAWASVDSDQAKMLVLDILGNHLKEELTWRVRGHLMEIIAMVEKWWDKYHISLLDGEVMRTKETDRIMSYLKDLRYA